MATMASFVWRSKHTPVARARAFALLAGAVLCVLATTTSAQSQECEGLAEDSKALCLLMVACAAIDDADRREECFRVAANTVQDEPPGVDPQEATAPSETIAAPSAATPSADEQVPRRMQETVLEPATGVVRKGAARVPRANDPGPSAAKQAREPSAPEGGKKRRWRERLASVLRRDDDAVEEGVVVAKQVRRTSLEIPRRFAATVTAVHNSGGGRRLVALDDTLLFESDRAGEGALRVGDKVRVVRASRLYGRRFQISGPARRPFAANRVRCEREDITPATRRQCRLLDD